MLLNIADRRIHYDLIIPEQNAQVVCFMHSLMLDGGMWAEQATPLVQSGFGVLRVDIRGHGGSDPAGSSADMDDLAGDLVRVVELLEIRTMHLIGLSLGGMIAQAFATNHPARLLSLTLCDTLPATLSASRDMLSQRIESVRQSRSVSQLAEATMQRFLTEEFKADNPGRWRELHETIRGTTSDGYVACGGATLNFDFTERLRSFPVRTLVVCGSADPLTPPDENRRLATMVPRGRYQEIPGARHLSNVEKPATFNRIMIEWLTQQT
jgi:3-oxoadipate enol-lactonase